MSKQATLSCVPNQLPDQARRNSIGTEITYQMDALLCMLNRERRVDEGRIHDLLNAILPRLHELNLGAMAMFSDKNVFNNESWKDVVYGKESFRVES